jgi:glycosyltransferase involved in cell wall biosynthesis
MFSISIVIPVYQAEMTLRELHRQLVAALQRITNQFEIVFVEDCGKDRSWEIIEELASSDDHVRGFRLRRNFGQHNALLCGIIAARHGIIVTMDDDLQHPVEYINPLIEKLAEGHDVVYGAPEEEQHHPLRNMASMLTKLMLRSAMGVEEACNISAFRAFRTELRQGFVHFRGTSPSIDVLLTWTTGRFAAIKVPHRPRTSGKSGYTIRKLVRHAFNTITGFSTLPLKLASIVGFVFTLFGISVLCWVLLRFLISGTVVPGFPFLASIITIFSGAQLFALGIFGEYLGRLYFRSFDAPPFVLRESCGGTFENRNRELQAQQPPAPAWLPHITGRAG